MTLSEEERGQGLNRFIEELLIKSPERLAWLLYRLDVDEKKLKHAIGERPQDEVDIITNKVIEKLKTIRSKNTGNTDESPDWSFDLDD